MQPTVSIIIPVYNIENYIVNCLESVLNQSYTRLEIICIDDGSTDFSAQKIKEFCKKDNRIKYIYQSNAGVSAARNKGLENADGKYIFFLDGDDYIHPQTMEALIDCAVRTQADMVCADYTITHNLNEAFISIDDIFYHSADFDELYFHGNKLGKCAVAKLIKSNLAKAFRFFEGIAMGEDGCYILKLLNENISVYATDIPLYYYYRREGSATKSKLTEKKLTIVNAYDMLCDYTENSVNKKVRAYCLRSVFYQLNHKRRLYKGTEYESLAETTCKQIGKKHLKAFLREKNISLKIRLIHTLRFFFRFIK